ncbi:hypothetical protein C356_01978 [Cryptococcus neoformans c45]|nr:hypothetical protein C356_01978 [Cryptococcus neoformans var. grubii c45]
MGFEAGRSDCQCFGKNRGSTAFRRKWKNTF